MEISSEKIREYSKRLILSRTRILCKNGFYGILLMNMRFALDSTIGTAATDGKKIYFDPVFMNGLSDKELDFVMMHEIMHVALRHCKRGKNLDNDAFNIACDIVVNSNIMHSLDDDLSSIYVASAGGVSMHLAPNGQEGYLYTAEEVYNMLPSYMKTKQSKESSLGEEDSDDSGCKKGNGGHNKKSDKSKRNDGGWDNHTKWEEMEDEVADDWLYRTISAAKASEIRKKTSGRGNVPLGVERIVKEFTQAQTDWRTVLADFVQEEVVDYSFTPPDRRFDGPFYLPDFNGTDIAIKDLLFMVDTSGSVSDTMISEVYSEIKGALDAFDGKLQGWLGFFDAKVVEAQPFDSVESLKDIRPIGGGGTSFSAVFKYLQEFIKERDVSCLVIITDGQAPYPKQTEAVGIPVLWIINNEKITPPWGKVARITTESE